MNSAETELSFEEAVARLEEIVASMESGQLPLQECLSRFEQAVSLSRQCAQQLEAAEKRISVLTEEGLRPVSENGWQQSRDADVLSAGPDW